MIEHLTKIRRVLTKNGEGTPEDETIEHLANQNDPLGYKKAVPSYIKDLAPLA
ncbi:MAG: hypothetical protein ACJA0C_000273 [Candidatus Endobugula sp.]